MKTVVRFDEKLKTYEFDMGRGLAVSIPNDEFTAPLMALRILYSLSQMPWFSLRHLKQFLELTRLHASWPVWYMQS